MTQAVLGRGGRALGRAGKALGRGLSGTAVPRAALRIIGPADLPDGVVGVVYTTTQMVAQGVTGIAQWSATGLPAGLLIDPDTGIISGQPTTQGSNDVVIILSDDFGTTSRGYAGVVITTTALVITTSGMSDGQIGAPYSASMAAVNGATPYTWSAVETVSGTPHAFPYNGLAINPSTGQITGTPTGAAGTRSITVTVTDNNSVTASRTFTPNFTGPALSITTTSPLAPAENGDSSYSAVINVSGGTGTRTYSMIGAPAGMTIGNLFGAGVIAGPANDTPGTYSNLIVTVTDSIGVTTSKTFTLVLTDPIPQPTPTAFTRRFGFGNLNGPNTEIDPLLDAIAAGTDRLAGGWHRLGFDWNAVDPDLNGISTAAIPWTTRAGKVDHQIAKTTARPAGANKVLAGAFYTAGPAQRHFTFQGSTIAGQKVIWNGGVGSGIGPQGITQGGRGETGGHYVGGGGGPGVSVHGPGISGNHWVKPGGQDSAGLVLDGGVTAGQSGTYTVGGTNSNDDVRLQALLPVTGLSDFGKFVKDLVTKLSTRIVAVELGNETNQTLGSAPFTDVTMQFKQWCHAWVGAKLANPDVIVLAPGCASTQSGPPGGRLETPDFYDRVLDAANGVAGTNCTNHYFSDLCSANGLGSMRAAKACPRLPFDGANLHAYGPDPLTIPSTAMNWIAYVWNQCRLRGGGGAVPIALTEQGPGWTNLGLPGFLDPRGSFMWMRNLFNLCWGNVRWPHNALGGLEDSSLTYAERRTLAQSIFLPVISQCIEELDGFGDHVGLYKSDGTPKFDSYALNAASTTIAAASNNQALPQGSIAVASTTVNGGFKPTDGWLLIGPASGGYRNMHVHYTSKDATHFLGCTGGAGTLLTGMKVTPANSQLDALIHADG